MAVFDESKVINCLHIDKAEIGKKYYFRDSLFNLKVCVENKKVDYTGVLTNVVNEREPFRKDNEHYWELIYPYEEPPKKRMTNRQLSEWLAKGNGERSTQLLSCTYDMHHYNKNEECEEVPSGFVIRPWGSDEWIEPTEDVYLRDCK